MAEHKVMGIVVVTLMLAIVGTVPALATISFGSSSSSEWTDSTSMLYPRAWPCVVTLPDGEVFASGGLTTDGPTSTTEMFDPVLGIWRPGPTMMEARVGHTCTLLGDGTLMVCGGSTPDGTTASAEIIDLSIGASLALPDMYFAREGHASATLPDGRVLVSGGWDMTTGTLKQAEVYDPEDHEWLPAGNMCSPRTMFSMHLVPGGSVLAVAGDSGGTSELYSIDSNSWGGSMGMDTPRYAAASATLDDGRVLVAGGILSGSPLRSSELYDPDTGGWTTSGSMMETRAHFSLSVMTDGRVMAAGSWSSLGTSDTSEVMCPCKLEWTEGPELARDRGAHGSVVLTNGTLMLMGGWSSGSVTASTEMLLLGPVPPEPPGPPDEPSGMCEPMDIAPLVMQTAGELPGHSEYGFLAKLLVAQKYYDIGDIEECLFMMDVFHQHIEAFLMSGHISDESASLLYDAYAEVVECLGGTPLRPLPP